MRNPAAAHCLCGAMVVPGKRQCPKCRSRARWLRRKFVHDGL
jgi:uncharacterized OB-fold protein